MEKLSQLDENFRIPEADAEGIRWYNAKKKPFSVYGFTATEDGFARIPQEIADTVNERVRAFNRHTAGGRVRFACDAPKICIRTKIISSEPTSKFSRSGKAGFCLYAGKDCRSIFLPPNEPVPDENGVIFYSSVSKPLQNQMTEYTIVLPVYAAVLSLEIGLPEGYIPQEASGYPNEKPIVYYGSSITQGGCVSHPGNTYQEIICRQTGLDYRNLGFSNGARGEQRLAEYISGLPMCCFVMDYDHNAPSVEYLQNTHEAFFKTIRAAQPKLPVIMMTRPDVASEENLMRRDVVRTTYENARKCGDRHVYFLDGTKFYEDFGGMTCSVDCVHPNDLGFYAIARKLLPVLKKAIAEAE